MLKVRLIAKEAFLVPEHHLVHSTVISGEKGDRIKSNLLASLYGLDCFMFPMTEVKGVAPSFHHQCALLHFDGDIAVYGVPV